MTSIDWGTLMGEAEDGFTLAPPGDYGVIVREAEAMTYRTGNRGIKVKFAIESGPNAGNIIFNNFVLTPDNPKALGFFFRNMRTFGMDADFFAKNPPLEALAEFITGRRVVVNVKHEDYQGQTQLRVNAVKPPIGDQVVSGPVSTSGPSLVPSMPKTPLTPSVSTQMPSTPPPVPPSI